MSKNKDMKKRPKANKGTLRRVLRDMFACYPVATWFVILSIVFSAAVAAMPAIFMQQVIQLVTDNYENGTAETWKMVVGEIVKLVVILASLYLVSLITNYVYHRMLASMTQGYLKYQRDRLFNRMQSLPIRYFDTHKYGDIMSSYTNDIDAMRQLISESLPQVLSSAVIVLSVFFIMLWFNLTLTAFVTVGVILMVVVTRSIGGRSSRFFLRQQRGVAKVEGYVEEMMAGQKVVKVFCHEEASCRDFDKLNDELCHDATSANRFANMLMPILFNLGNIMYVLVAIIGGAMIVSKMPTVGISTWILDGEHVLVVSVVIPFLSMTKQFAANIGQVSGQINPIVMGLAGASRLYELMDEEPETDEGYVTLVNATEAPDGTITECNEHTGVWAWKHPHAADGTVTYTRLTGDVRMYDVDFGYVPEKIVLHNVTLYAEPGQKVAFVGATGAGKTTITNLINRFYDIADGKIRYDGININKIKKSALRRSLGVVLQDTNLFTGTVMENIRYGNLDASDEECIEAAKLVNAHDFITRLPEGYNTHLYGGGANLSQGQRQLLSIARAAVADPPVMILDEATSSIDTRTEEIVQRGMDALMHGRTVFVIAHRLSTVKNADVIMVLDAGRIIERGSHDELIEKKGRYYQLYTGAFELE